MWMSSGNFFQESVHLLVRNVDGVRLGLTAEVHRCRLQHKYDLCPSTDESFYPIVHPLEHHRLPSRGSFFKDTFPSWGIVHYRIDLVSASPDAESRVIALNGLGFSAIRFALTLGRIRSEIDAIRDSRGDFAAYNPT